MKTNTSEVSPKSPGSDLLGTSNQPASTTTSQNRRLITRGAWQAQLAERNGISGEPLSNLAESFVPDLSDPVAAADALVYMLGEIYNPPITSLMYRYVDYIEAAHLKDVKQSMGLTEQPVVPTNPFLDESTIDTLQQQMDVDKEVNRRIVTDPHVQAFMRNRDLSLGEQALHEAWPKFLELFDVGLAEGIQLGYIPSDVHDRFAESVQKSKVQIADAAAVATLPDVAIVPDAYYYAKDDSVGVVYAPLHEIIEPYEHLLGHEFVHKESGGTFDDSEEEGEQANRVRVGYSTDMKSGEMVRTGLNEAATHHVTLGILYGDFETINPDKRTDGDKTYYGYRKILAAYTEGSSGIIEVRTITNGLFEDTAPEGGITMRRKLVKQSRQAYGPAALTKLDKLFEAYRLFDAYGYVPLEELLSKIHPAEIDEHGNIVKTGWIDAPPTLLETLSSE